MGFDVVDLLASRHGGRLKAGKERALVDEVRIDGRRVALAEPTTFMNLSGESVSPLVRRYGIEDPTRLVVVQDELDLPTGRVRVKVGGGLAGHNGLKSIAQGFGGPDFWRVRVGVGRPDSTDPDVVARYVLSRFSEPDDEVIALIERAAEHTERLVEEIASEDSDPLGEVID